MNSEIEISTTITIKEAGYDEKWLQDQIWNNPTCIGLGDLETVTKEKAVSSGGWLDILMKNPEDDSMYEVEVMLGETDPSHIIRTIEYWDLIKRKWPQRQHYAVLIAERITKRFFNVIQILSNSVPLIAIQVNIIKTSHGQSLHFTKILDVYEEPDDETVSNSEANYDPGYWKEKSAQTLKAAEQLQEITKDLYGKTELVYNKNYIAISKNQYNQMLVLKRSGNSVLIAFRFGNKKEEIEKILQNMDIQYTEKPKSFRFSLPVAKINQSADQFRQIAKLNNEWWQQ